MKIYCSRSDLNRALSNVSHSIPVRTTTNIIEGILAEAGDGYLRLTTTDTNMTTETSIYAECQDKCEFLIPAKLFTAIVNKLQEEEMIIDYDQASSKIKIKCGGSNSELICFSAEDFPRIKLKEEHNEIILSKEEVKKLIRKTAFSASRDEYNGVLTGVYVEIGDGRMRMTGVDPYRIATYQIEADRDIELSVVIPAKLIIEAAKIISDEGDDKLSFSVSDNKVILKFDNNKIIINTFSGKFIDYRRILNKEGSINVRVKKNELLRSTERASLLASVQNNNLIRFNIDSDLILIKSLNEEGNIEEKVEIINDGDSLDIGLNSRYLKDALSAIDDEEVIMNFRDSITPCIIKPLKGDRYKYLILPIRMN